MRELSVWLRAVRVHQWPKNLLVYLPLFLSHQWDNLAMVLNATLGFISFCLCASGLYLINDLRDLASDRLHPRKRYRPLANGQVSERTGYTVAAVLIVASCLVLVLLNRPFAIALAVYLLLGAVYSVWLRTLVLVDVLSLAGFYTIRIVAGCMAISVEPSFWLLAFSMFLFFSLATLKRYTELNSTGMADARQASGRNYHTADVPVLQSLGVAAGYCAVLVAALYIDSPESSALYRSPQLLWLICPGLLFWISRLWMLAGRGVLQDDPVAYTLGDRVSWAFLAAVAVCAWIAV